MAFEITSVSADEQTYLSWNGVLEISSKTDETDFPRRPATISKKRTGLSSGKVASFGIFLVSNRL